MTTENNQAADDAVLLQALADDPKGDGADSERYRIWASDDVMYGPVSLSILKEWTADGRVARDTWVYAQLAAQWRRAGEIPMLERYLPEGTDTLFLEQQALQPDGIDPFELRQFPIFTGLSNTDLANFLRLGETMRVTPGQFIVHRREPGDAIYFVLSGEARAQISVGSEEKVLNAISAGEFFGEMAMFTHSPRSADVVASKECRLLKFTAAAFHELMTRQPASAAPMLYWIASTMAQRIVNTNTRLQQEVTSGFVWR